MSQLTLTPPGLATDEPMTPREIVEALDRFIVGQADAKRAVAIAIRNRWRRRQLPDEMQGDVSPKNILMIGPTGVGKTEIARRLAKLTGAPFIKVEATKYTEVGYYGRDVESMVRDLVENAIGLVRAGQRDEVKQVAEEKTRERLLDLLCPQPSHYEFHATARMDDANSGNQNTSDTYPQTRARIGEMLDAGQMEHRKVELTVESKSTPVMLGGIGMEHMDVDFQGMLEKIIPKSKVRREMTVSQARRVIFEQECDRLLDDEKINQMAIELAENLGIIFLDEIDKIIAAETKGADVSRQGVQRDLLPIVEGCTVQTKYGSIRTDHILFVGAGAFHRHQPNELMPELQGRFPIRVELQDLTKDDFVRILREPQNSLTRQYESLIGTEGVEVTFTDDAVEEMARIAFVVNQSTQNIGARRLYTILERVLEELSFAAPEMKRGHVEINAAYVSQRLKPIADDEDLSRYVL
ncbi:MAG TPA: ATP-dependent protease ATPase subunit HslU [Pirellulaceae bacterium]|nr:ATP-dependent protease ATPase subunit HslU [Pirellulaceae bacterium]